MTVEVHTESNTVQLTRMEGVLALIHHKVDTVIPRVEHLEGDVGQLKMSVQRLGDEAEANATTVVATAKALREAKEADDRKIAADLRQSETFWTPYNRLITILGGISASVAVIQYINR